MGDAPVLGLALGGGALRGAAHVGVLKVLHEAGVRPAFIAGTSIGAIVGAAYAAGHEPAHLEEVFSRAGWSSFVRPTLRLKRSLLDTGRQEQFLRDQLGLTTFEALRIPFAAVTTDLRRGTTVVKRTGDVAQAVRASSALPGLFPPVEVDDCTLVDGGLLENLPTRTCRAMGADYVIGVDLLPPHEGAILITNVIQIWQRTIDLMIVANHAQHGTADVTILPPIGDMPFADFKQVAELVRRGEAAARAALPGIARALGL